MVIGTENWDHKGKFPPGIKPLLAHVALKAVALDEYDDHFFNLMPVLFPYNKFTMSVSCSPSTHPLSHLVEEFFGLFTYLIHRNSSNARYFKTMFSS